jgi:hypothetical protein
MGYRSTFISQDYVAKLSEWIKEKWSDKVLFIQGTLVATKFEWKIYDNEFFEDYQKAVIESGFWSDRNIPICFAVIAEDDFISKVKIYKDKIEYFLMDEGHEWDHVWLQG